MKKYILIIICVFTLSPIFGQGTTTTLFDSTGWSPSGGYSQWYRLRYFTLLSNPGGLINRNTREIDSLFHALIVYTDTTQLVIQNDTLRTSPYASGIAAFATTSQYDTLTIAGLKSTDVFIVNIRDSIPTANDILSVKLITGKAIVQRPSSGTSGLPYSWIWRRRY